MKDEDGRPWRLEALEDDRAREQGAQIYDPEHGLTFRVTIAPRKRGTGARLTSLSIEPDAEQRITHDTLRVINPTSLAAAAAAYLDEAAELEPGETLPWTSAPRAHGEVPDLAELAAKVKAGATLADLAKEYGGVSRATVSRWIAAARAAVDDQGEPLLGPPTTGRPKKQQPSNGRKDVNQ